MQHHTRLVTRPRMLMADTNNDDNGDNGTNNGNGGPAVDPIVKLDFVIAVLHAADGLLVRKAELETG